MESIKHSFNIYTTMTSGLEYYSELEFLEKFPNYISSLEIRTGRLIISMNIDEKKELSIKIKQIMSSMKSIEHIYLILECLSIEEVKSEEKGHKIKEIITGLSNKLQKNKENIRFFIEQTLKIYDHPNVENVQFRVDIKKNKNEFEDKNALGKEENFNIFTFNA